MPSPELELVYAFETHEVEAIRKLLDSGVSATAVFKGKPMIDHLTEMYSRGDRFTDCLRLLLERGATLRDPATLPVLLNDADGLRTAIHKDRTLLTHRTDMVCCFTPLIGASLLHIAAEYGHLAAARVLVEEGADVNATAAVNEFGMNGHTPLFHTVNSNANRSAGVMKLLLDAGARVDVRLAGVVWGKGFDWETTFFDVTPISYAQLGLMPQVHRKQEEIYSNIRALLSAGGRRVPPLENVPNKHLK